MKRLSLAALAVAGIVTALPAAAQFAKPEDAIKYRKSAMTRAWRHTSAASAPWPTAACPSTPRSRPRTSRSSHDAQRCRSPPSCEGTDKGDTRAKPEIWTQKDKFAAAVAKMQEEVAKLDGGGQDAATWTRSRPPSAPVGQSCKACHDDFRKE